MLAVVGNNEPHPWWTNEPHPCRKRYKKEWKYLTATDIKQSNEYSYDHEKKVIIITTHHKRHGILILRY